MSSIARWWATLAESFGEDHRWALIWSTLAVLCGVLLAVLPIPLTILLFAAAVIVVSGLIDTRIALMATLIVAPFKILLETELPAAKALPIDVGQIALLLTAAIWLAKSIAAQRRIDLVYTPIILPVALFLIAAALSLWNTVQLWNTLKELLVWAEMLIVIVLVASLARDHELGVGWLAGGIIAAGVAQAIIGIYEFRGGSGAAHLWILDFRYFRAFGSFGQPNPFGAFMGLTLSLALGVSYGSGTEAWQRYQAYRVRPHDPVSRRALIEAALNTGLYSVSALIIGIGLLVSWSRGAWLGFGAAALTLVFFAPRHRLVGAGLVALLAGGLAVGVITGLAPASLVSRISDFANDLGGGIEDARGVPISDENYAVLERIAHWQAAVGMATDFPWLGVGFGAYEIAYPRYALVNWPMALGHAHNYYLNLLAETGVVGLTAYLAAWIMIIVLTLRVLGRETGFRRGVALGLLGVWAHLAVHSMFDKLYVNNLFLHIGAMLGLIGVLLVWHKTNAKI